MNKLAQQVSLSGPCPSWRAVDGFGTGLYTRPRRQKLTGNLLGDASVGADDRPNILFILSDDQGQWAAGCYGNPEIRTPSIDRLAANGLRFDHFFVATPVCSPSRAALLTGRIPSQHGVHEWIDRGNAGPEARAFTANEVALTDVLALDPTHDGRRET